MFRTVGSVRFIGEDMGSPEISLYSSSSFAGKLVTDGRIILSSLKENHFLQSERFLEGG